MSHPLRRLAAVFSLGLLVAVRLPAQESAPKTPVGDVPPPPAQELPAQPAAPELTLEECIKRALAKNFDLEIGRYNPQIAQDDIAVAKGPYETKLSVTGSVGGVKNPAGTLSGISSSHTRDVRIGVTQELYTGTTLSASSELDRTSTNPALTLNPAYDADVTLGIRQSLLRGFGYGVGHALVERAKIGLDRANLDYKAQALDVIQATENAYFDLAYVREQLTVRNFSLALAQRLYDEAQTRRQTGVATDLDVLTGEVGVANARRGVILAEQQVKDSQDALLALIGQFELDAPVGTVHFNEISDATPVFASSFDMAKKNQPDFLSSEAAIEQYKLDLRLAKDAAKPDLSVGGAVGLNGSDRNTSDAYGNAFDRESNSWQVDVAFNYSLGRGADRARQRQSLAVLNREQTRLRQIEQNIAVQVRAAVRSVEANLESVKIATLASSLSQKQYELEKARFDAGLSTSRRVLEAQDDLETARIAELQAKVALHTSITALHRLEGSSLQRYAIQLP